MKTILVLDAAEIDGVSAFWAGLLDGTVSKDDDWHSILVDGEWRLAVQPAPDHVPPEWPDGALQQIHLDLWVDDLEAAQHRGAVPGRSALRPAEDLDAHARFQVYADPAGHPCCFCRG